MKPNKQIFKNTKLIVKRGRERRERREGVL